MHSQPQSAGGRRFQRLQKLSRILSCSLFSAIVLSFLGYGSVAERWENPAISIPDENLPTMDELQAATDEENEEYREFIYENEYPMALGVYDRLFAEEDADVPDGELQIIKTDLSKNPSPGTIHIKNNTDYTIHALDYLAADTLSLPTVFQPIEEKADPVVLIYHTHGTEGYAEEGRISYTKKDLPRSRDITKNVVAVGKVLADTLNACGIPTLHCETMFDDISYTNSYTYSRQALQDYMEQYPSIQYAFDIHRDALVSSTYAYKVLTYDESTPVAQIMLVVGTDSAGAEHPNWQKNLAFAVDTQYLLTKRLSNLVRPICIKNPSYNQQHAGNGILIEIGTCVNTLTEAKTSAKILGETLAGLILAERET